ncbi:MAG: preprotein translocase subunit SecE [Intestinimonas sp.]|jgi:preprotein translocase subunit SecE|nr:preprotein translocase subunit SecE [Intestinimonas sp.]
MSENEKVEQAAAAKLSAPKSEKPAKKKDGASKKKEPKPNAIVRACRRIARWFREMKIELKKVQWPTAKQTLKSTGIVILCVIIVGIFIWCFDAVTASVVDALLNLFGKG